jgi:hypothetical protein
MEKIMSKTNTIESVHHTHTSNHSYATLKDQGALADTELDAVTGGYLRGSNSDDRKGGRYLAMS